MCAGEYIRMSEYYTALNVSRLPNNSSTIKYVVDSDRTLSHRVVGDVFDVDL